MQAYAGHGHEVLDVSCASDNTRFASCGGDKTVFVWEVGRGEPVRRVAGHAARVNAVRWAGEAEELLVSASLDGCVKVWDLKSGAHRPVVSLEEARDSVSALAVAGHEILAGSVDGRVRSYDVRMGMVTVDVVAPGKGDGVTSLDLGKGGETVLVGTLGSKIRLMDRRDGTCLKTFEGEGFKNEEYRIRSCLAMGDNVVVSGSENGEIYVWDVLQGKVVERLRQREGGGKEKEDVVTAVVWCPSRMEWASAGGDGSVAVWGVE